jgi:hypothetical protein
MSSLHSKQYSVAELNTPKEKVSFTLLIGRHDKSPIETIETLGQLNNVEKEWRDYLTEEKIRHSYEYGHKWKDHIVNKQRAGIQGRKDEGLVLIQNHRTLKHHP